MAQVRRHRPGQRSRGECQEPPQPQVTQARPPIRLPLPYQVAAHGEQDEEHAEEEALGSVHQSEQNEETQHLPGSAAQEVSLAGAGGAAPKFEAHEQGQRRGNEQAQKDVALGRLGVVRELAHGRQDDSGQHAHAAAVPERGHPGGHQDDQHPRQDRGAAVRPRLLGLADEGDEGAGGPVRQWRPLQPGASAIGGDDPVVTGPHLAHVLTMHRLMRRQDLVLRHRKAEQPQAKEAEQHEIGRPQPVRMSLGAKPEATR